MSLHSFSDVLSSERLALSLIAFAAVVSNAVVSRRTHKVQEIENQYMQWEKSPVLVNLPQKNEVGVFIPSTGMS